MFDRCSVGDGGSVQWGMVVVFSGGWMVVVFSGGWWYGGSVQWGMVVVFSGGWW